MRHSRAEIEGSARLILNIDEYIAWVCPDWDKDSQTLERVEEVFGLPSSYPCRVWRETRRESEPDWGDGQYEAVCIMTLKEFVCGRPFFPDWLDEALVKTRQLLSALSDHAEHTNPHSPSTKKLFDGVVAVATAIKCLQVFDTKEQ